MPAKRYLVYADGSCIGNPGPGGWGAIVIDQSGGTPRELNGHAPATTNNKMEITAAIEGLRATEPGSSVVLRSDSQYVIYTMTKNWKRKMNRDLWERLDREVAARDVRFEWIRGHGDDPLNDRADELANLGAARRLIGRP